MPLYHLHPMIVHFPIALLIIGIVLEAASQRLTTVGWIKPAATFLLYAGRSRRGVPLERASWLKKPRPRLQRPWMFWPTTKKRGFGRSDFLRCIDLEIQMVQSLSQILLPRLGRGDWNPGLNRLPRRTIGLFLWNGRYQTLDIDEV